MYSCLFVLTGGIEEKDEDNKEAAMVIVTPKTTAKERPREERRIKFGDRTMEVKVGGEGGE